jgi:hypothetical protein
VGVCVGIGFGSGLEIGIAVLARIGLIFIGTDKERVDEVLAGFVFEEEE